MKKLKNDTASDTVYEETVKRLNWLFYMDESTVKARLAELRHGVSKMPGEDPVLWGMLFSELPESMLGKYGKPSKEEWAIYSALVLFAVHQQGNDPHTKNMNVKGISIGKAAGRLVCAYGGTDDDRERVSRKFNQIALASDIETLTYYLRTFIPLLREYEIGMDYARLAQDIFYCQAEASRASVRLRWGRDYYSSSDDKKEANNE